MKRRFTTALVMLLAFALLIGTTAISASAEITYTPFSGSTTFVKNLVVDDDALVEHRVVQLRVLSDHRILVDHRVLHDSAFFDVDAPEDDGVPDFALEDCAGRDDRVRNVRAEAPPEVAGGI